MAGSPRLARRGGPASGVPRRPSRWRGTAARSPTTARPHPPGRPARGGGPRRPRGPPPTAQRPAVTSADTDRASRGEANEVPHTNRISGPKVAADGRPVKYSPGTLAP